MYGWDGELTDFGPGCDESRPTLSSQARRGHISREVTKIDRLGNFVSSP